MALWTPRVRNNWTPSGVMDPKESRSEIITVGAYLAMMAQIRVAIETPSRQ